MPKAVFVFHAYNDPANDLAHPHTDVIDGWQVNHVGLDRKNALVHLDKDDLKRNLKKLKKTIK